MVRWLRLAALLLVLEGAGHVRATPLPAALDRVDRCPGLAPAPVADARAPEGREPDPSEEAFLAVARRLAGEDLRGRGLGEPGLERAAAYLVEELRDAGLQPLFADDYAEAFTVQRTRPWHGKATLRLGATVLEAGRDFVPMRTGGPGDARGPVVFVGYGLRHPQAGYDDYAGLDVRGAIVVALRHEPSSGAPEWLGPRPVLAADPERKASLAADLGAAAFVLVNDPAAVARDPASDAPLQLAERPYSVGIPCASVTWRAAQPALAALGLDLAAEQAALDGDAAPRSRTLGCKGRVQADVELDEVTLVNLGGWLPGAPEASVTLVGAHYDHLGPVPGRPDAWFPGADDNASGVAALLLLARAMAAAPGEPKAGPVAFLLLTGEESGSLGIEALRLFPRWPLERAGAFVNLDQVGRLRADGRFLAVGTGTSPAWPALLERARNDDDLHPVALSSGYAPSDQAALAEVGLPVLLLFTGVTREQHTPDDTPDRLNAPGALRLVAFARRLVDELRTSPALPRVPTPPRPGTDGLPTAGSASAGEWGLELDLAFEGDGARLASVLPGSPAAAAGLAAGDAIVAWDGRPVASAADLEGALKLTDPTHAPVVRVRRSSEVLEVTLGAVRPPHPTSPTRGEE